MKTFLHIISISLLIFAFQSCSYKSVRGNGVLTKNEFQISDYKNIDFGGSANIIYEQKSDAAPYLLIETDENILPLLIVKSENGTLEIKHKENIRPTKYNIVTNSTELENISTSGSVKLHLKGKLEAKDLSFRLSGSGNIISDEIICNSVTSRVSGSGDITLVGQAKTIDSSISGSGKTHAMNMQTETAICTVSGSGNFEVNAEKQLKVRVSGSGNVRYKGHPQIDQSISGSGKVIKVD